MNNNNKLICIFCNNPFTKRSNGDHVVPQGLGEFRPEFVLDNVCEKCDNRHGNTFEQVALQTGLMGLIRRRKQIISKNNRKRKVNNPYFDKKYGIDSGCFSIHKIGDENNMPIISDDGTVYSPNIIRLLKNGKTDRIIPIPPEQDVSKIGTFINNIYSKYKQEYQIQIELNRVHKESICNELVKQGVKLGETIELPHIEQKEIFLIHSIITEEHLRFIVNIVLKSMVYCGYPISLLKPLIDYADKGIKQKDDITILNKYGTKINFLSEPELDQFYHYFEWNFTQNRIIIKASFLGHSNYQGLGFLFNFSQGFTDEIIIPYGSLLLKYGKTKKEGKVYLKKGDCVINQ